SVTAAVSVWLPSERTSVREANAPRYPWRLELQRRPAERSPSKSSKALAERLTGVPAGAEPPLAGAVTVTSGGALGARTRTVIAAAPRWPSESVTAAVIVWLPAERVRGPTVAPDPSAPSRLEVQERLALRLPSSMSLAVPVKVTGSPTNTTFPFAGAVMRTLGRPGARSTTRRGGAAVSRERYCTPSLDALTRASTRVPSTILAPVTSKSTSCPCTTGPWLAS